MSERRVVEAAEDFLKSKVLPYYYCGAIVPDHRLIYIKDYRPGRGEIVVVEPDDTMIGLASQYFRMFKVVEEDDE